MMIMIGDNIFKRIKIILIQYSQYVALLLVPLTTFPVIIALIEGELWGHDAVFWFTKLILLNILPVSLIITIIGSRLSFRDYRFSMMADIGSIITAFIATKDILLHIDNESSNFSAISLIVNSILAIIIIGISIRLLTLSNRFSEDLNVFRDNIASGNLNYRITNHRFISDTLFGSFASTINEITDQIAEKNIELFLRTMSENIKESERNRLLLVFDELPGFLYLQKSDLSITFRNRYTREVFKDIGKKPCYEVFYGRENKCDECQLSVVIKTGNSYEKEVQLASGKYYHIYYFPFTDIDGTKLVLIFGLDITDQMEAEKNLTTSEIKFQELFDNMSNGIAVYKAINDGEDFIFVDINKAGEKIDNLKKEDIIGKKLTEMFPKVKDFGFLDVFQRVWKTGKPEQIPASFYEDQQLSGWRENNIYKLSSGEIISVFNDITKRKLAEEAQQQLSHDLKERVKELTLLNRVLQLLVGQGKSMDDIFEECVTLIPSAWQYPEITCARIIVGEKSYTTDNFCPTPIKQFAEIIVSAKKAGSVEVYYLEEKPFLKEEQDLVDNIARILGEKIERITWQQAILENEEKYRTLFNSANDAIFVCGITADGSETTFIEVNDVACDRYGYSREELLNMTFSDITDPSQPPLPISVIDTLLSEGRITFERVQMTSTGKKIPVEINAHLFTLQNEERVISIVRDITNRKIILESKRIEHILNAISNGVIVFDTKGKIHLVNRIIREYCSILSNIEEAEDIERCLFSNDIIAPVLKKIIKDNNPEPVTVEPIKGVFLQFNMTKKTSIIKSDIGRVVEVRDVSPFVEFDNMRKTLVSTVSHELRTPISIILQSITNLEKYGDKLNDKQKKRLIKAISCNAKLQAEMIEDLLIISRLDERRLELNWNYYYLYEIVNNVIQQLEMKIESKGIIVDAEVDESIQIFGDGKRIEQVLR
ncbi:MAG: PAS domain S-box protein, partial [Candidatus Hodarchaeales archaeon]